jgi:hypothetical protein
MFLQNLYARGSKPFAIPSVSGGSDSDQPVPTNAKFSEINAARDVLGENFFSGQIDFHVRNPMYRWIHPGTCGFKMRVQYSIKDKGNGTYRPIRMADGVAFAQDIGSHMFQSIDWQVEGMSIARVTRDIPQVAAMLRRLDGSQNHIHKVLNTLNLESHLFYERQKQTAIDGAAIAAQQSKVKVPAAHFLGVNACKDNKKTRMYFSPYRNDNFTKLEIDQNFTPGTSSGASATRAANVGNYMLLTLEVVPGDDAEPAPDLTGGNKDKTGTQGTGYKTLGDALDAFYDQVGCGDFLQLDELSGLTPVGATGSGVQKHSKFVTAAKGGDLSLELKDFSQIVLSNVDVATLLPSVDGTLPKIEDDIATNGLIYMKVRDEIQLTTTTTLYPGLYEVANIVRDAGGNKVTITFNKPIVFTGGNGADTIVEGGSAPGRVATLNNLEFVQDTRFLLKGEGEYATPAVGFEGLRSVPLEVVRKSELNPQAKYPYTAQSPTYGAGGAGGGSPGVEVGTLGRRYTFVVRCDDPSLYNHLTLQDSKFAVKIPGNALVDMPIQGLQLVKRDLEIEAKETFREAEIFFKLPINFFYLKHMLPGIPMTFALQPYQKTQFLKGIFETKSATALDDLKFDILNFELVTFTVDGPDIDDKKINLDLRSLGVHTQSNVRNRDLTSLVFSVSPSTEGLAIAFQDSRTDQNSQYSASDFKFYRNVGINKDDYDYMRHLSRFWIQYGDTIFPNQPMDPKLTPGIDNMAVDWMQTLMQTGNYFAYDPESYQDWKTKGMFWFYQCARPKNARNTDVKVNLQFTKDPDDPSPELVAADFANLRVMVFDIVRSVAEIVIQNGKVVDVYQQEIS